MNEVARRPPTPSPSFPISPLPKIPTRLANFKVSQVANFNWFWGFAKTFLPKPSWYFFFYQSCSSVLVYVFEELYIYLLPGESQYSITNIKSLYEQHSDKSLFSECTTSNIYIYIVVAAIILLIALLIGVILLLRKKTGTNVIYFVFT